MAWANAEDIGRFLVAAKVVTEPPEGLEGWVEIAKADVYSVTGYEPFFGEARTLTFDEPDSGRLWLPLGLLRADSVTISGAVMAEGRDYTISPREAWQSGNPVHAVDFGGGVIRSTGAMSEGVVIEGVWGRMFDSDPRAALVRHAHILTAAAMTLEYAMGAGGEVKAQTQGSVKIEYDTTSGKARADKWREDAARVLSGYRTVTL